VPELQTPPRGASERRFIADRRRGRDRRAAPRRRAIHSVTASAERRHVVDRRRGSEQRSTLERRAYITRRAPVETAAEHIRNALQLLSRLSESEGLTDELGNDLDAALRRLRLALSMIESR
jgi:hypothetical protein